MLQFLIVLAILVVVVVVVTGPLRTVASPSGTTKASPGPETTQVADLEAAREAKYREIRDAELDHSTGKLSDADFEALDNTLRAEAVEIMHALDRARRA